MADEVAHLLALDATLGYMGRRLKNSDYRDKFVLGYAQAHSDIAHIRSIVFLDWKRRDPEGVAAALAAGLIPEDHWAAIKAMPDLGGHRIFPREG